VKLACQEGLAPGATLREKVQNLERFGFDGMEVGGRGLPERVDEIKQALAGTAVRISSVCAGYGGCPLDADRAQRQVAINESKEILKAAGELGAVGLIFVPIFGGPRIPDLSPLADPIKLEKDLLVALGEELGEAAAAAGTLLLLEPLNRYETHLLKRLEDAVEIAERIGNPHVKIMADFFHMSIEERDIPASIRAAGSWIQHVHLADSTRLLPGYGHTDFKSGFAALKDVAFDKYMALECGVPGDPTVELPKCVEYLRSCM
jgi:sugar phosphate isomerase/epimerase